MNTLADRRIFLGLQETGYGYIEWNLPEALEYQPGQPIPIVLQVTNPSTEDREYQLYVGLFDPETGELIPDTLGLIQVDEEDSFTIAGESYIQMEGEVTSDQTNVILSILLYDAASDTFPSYVAVQLLAPASGWDLTSVFGGFFAVAALGMMMPMVTGIFKEKERSRYCWIYNYQR